MIKETALRLYIYIYIYIVSFNKINLCKYSKEAMCFSDI